MGSLDLLELPDLNKEDRKYVKLANTSAKALLSILDNVLEFSRLEQGNVEINAIDIDVREFCGELERANRHEVKAKGLSMAVEIADDVPQTVPLDPQRLRQVLDSLMANALKFTHDGGIHLSLRPMLLADGRSVLRFELRDTGEGVAAEVEEKIFTAFTQGDGSHTRRHGGVGLGLALSQRLTQAMGAEIGLCNDDKPGSCFFIDLPMPAGLPFMLVPQAV
jgi:signal transduction histidine kinase